MNEKLEAGIQAGTEMLGDEIGAALRGGQTFQRFGARLSDLGLRHVFAEHWANPGLDRRSRSLVTLGILIALRQPEEIRLHVRAGINNGLTVAEIEEIILHATAYAGFPAASLAIKAAAEEINAMGLGDAAT